MNQSTFVNLDDINAQLSSTEKMIKKAGDKIKDLKELKKKRENPELFKEENEDLKLSHQLSLEDIKIYKEEILKLKEEVSKNKKTFQIKEYIHKNYDDYLKLLHHDYSTFNYNHYNRMINYVKLKRNLKDIMLQMKHGILLVT